MRTTTIQALCLLAAAVLCAAPPSLCQGAPAGPIHPEPGIQPAQPPPQSTIRIQANEVVAPVTATDKSGEMILSLKQREFHVFDDGVELPVDHFGLGGDPLSIVLVVEASSRIAPLLPAIRRSGIVFAQPVLGQTAEAAILSYDDSDTLLEKFTTDPDSLERAINHLQTGTDGSHLYDAMARGISLIEERPTAQRRILLVVGEAQDTGSGATLGEVLRHAQIANVTIYSVGLSTAAAALHSPPDDAPPRANLPGSDPVPTGDAHSQEVERTIEQGGDLMAAAIWLLKTGKNAVGRNSLAMASRSTGGLHLNPKKERGIEKAMDAIGGELHSQYTISYRPPANETQGYHEIKVTVDRPGIAVRTRPGYYLADPLQ